MAPSARKPIVLTISFSEHEVDLIRRAAAHRNEYVAVFVRTTCLAKAKQELAGGSGR